jgi:hypothetical protein
MRRPSRVLLDSAAIGPALVLGLVVATAGLLLVTGQMHPYDVGVCITRAGPPPTQPPPPAPAWWREAILVANVAGFAIGHATSHLRSRVEAHRAPPGSGRAGSRIVQAVLIVFLAGGALLSAYEALSVVPDVSSPSFWPISYYVRCVNDVAPYQTLLGSAVVAFLLGHWLCHPGARPRRGRAA